MYEVEAKFQVAGLDGVRDTLRSLGATPAGRERQEDVFFLHPCRDLAAGDETLRLRVREDGAGRRHELTYKGPRQRADTKVRLETSLELAEDPTALLGHVGFAPGARLRKDRETWRWGGVTVALDELPGLGCFVEVEVLAEDVQAASAEVERASHELGLRDRIDEPYVELARRKGLLS